MKIIEPSAKLLFDFDGAEYMRRLERCGRVCYKSEANITEGSAEKFVNMLIKRGHESVLEHCSATFRIICDRAIMAELTRHRLTSFSIESTRYCDYSADRFGNELTVIRPCFFADESGDRAEQYRYNLWYKGMIDATCAYFSLREAGVPPEQARVVLPMSLATEIIVTANLREWRHILKLRTSSRAHPQMRQIAALILSVLREKLPVIFGDIEEGE